MANRGRPPRWTGKRMLGINLDGALYEALETLAADEGTNMGDFVRPLIVAEMKRRGKLPAGYDLPPAAEERPSLDLFSR